MKKRNLIIIAAVLAVGIVAMVVYLTGSRKATFSQDYHIEDTSSITRIYLADKQDNSVLLTRVGDSLWMVDNTYEANQPVIDLLLETLHDMRIRQQVNRAAVPTIIKDLAAHAIKVEVYQKKPFINWFGGKLHLFTKERLAVTYYVGRETQDMMASYMFREGDKVPCVIHIPGFRGFLTPRFVTDPLKWRSHCIVDLNVREIQRVELEIPAMPQESFAIVANGEGFDMEWPLGQRRAEGFDTARVAQMLASFTWLNFDEFAAIVPNSNADSCINGAPRTILRITDTTGRTRELKSYIKYTNPADLELMGNSSSYELFDINRLYAVIDNTDTVLIQYNVFDNIMQPASFFMGGNKTLYDE